MSQKQEKSRRAMESYLDDLFEDAADGDSHQSTAKSNPASFQLGARETVNTEEHRHEIERVERLLDDYNRRQQTPSLEAEDKVTLLRPVLEPDDEIIEETTDVTESSEDTDVSVDNTALEPGRYSERPEWSKAPFQALMFHVAGMELAVPLVSLGGIHRMDKEVTELFGKPDWFMGLTPGLEGNINVVDTCRWVMPEKYGEAKTKGLNYSFIIMLGESLWGMACSHVETAITVEPDNVKWRGHDTKRPWLAGMLIEERCVLLDVDVLIDLLDSNYQR